MSSRAKDIFQVLYKSSQPKDQKILANKFGVTPRTIRKDINDINSLLLPYDGEIVLVRNKGYVIKYKDRNMIEKFFQDSNCCNGDIEFPNNTEDRVIYIIKKLLVQKDYLMIDELAEELFVSKSTLNSDIKKVKEKLKKFNLIIKRRASYGIKVAGEEKNIRSCIAEHYIYSRNNSNTLNVIEDVEYFKDIDVNKIKKVILKNIAYHNIRIAEVNLNNLIHHICITIKRINNGFSIEEEFFTDIEVSELDREVINDIVEDLSNSLRVEFSEEEIDYLTLHISSKKSGQEYDKQNGALAVEIVNSMIKTIKRTYGYDFSKDEGLIHDLIQHIKPAIKRIKYSLNLRNPMVKEIKRMFPLSFNMTIEALDAIKDKIKGTFNDEELSLIALHLQAAMERQEEAKYQRKKVLLVCGSGIGSGRVLETKLNKIFGKKLDIMMSISMLDFDVVDKLECDFIVSTVPVKSKYKPVIVIKGLPTKKDIQKISRFINVTKKRNRFGLDEVFNKELFIISEEADTKDEIINIVANNLKDKKYAGDDFLPKVYERENVSSTALSEMVAIPHPVRACALKTGIAVCINKKGVCWDETKKVHIMLMLAIKPKEYKYMDGIFDLIVKILENDCITMKLLNCKSYEEFLKELKDIYRKDLEDI